MPSVRRVALRVAWLPHCHNLPSHVTPRRATYCTGLSSPAITDMKPMLRRSNSLPYPPSLPPLPGTLSLIQPALPSPAHRFSPVQNRTSPSAPITSCSRYRLATSTFNGLSKPGSLSNCCIALIVLLNVYVGAQCSLVNRVKHISPVWKCTFGWQIGVLNCTLGGERG